MRHFAMPSPYLKILSALAAAAAILVQSSLHADESVDPRIAAVAAILPPSPGACVMAIDRGEIVFQHGFGLADVAGNVPCTPQTNFRLASVTKQFTAACVLLLHERKQLALDDPLPKFFPGFPAYGATITVRHLLAHTSGLPEYEGLIPAGTTLPLDDLDVLQMLMETEQANFPAGEKWEYSNSGYVLLGLIVEQVAKKPFHDFLHEELLAPCAMTNSVLYVQGLNEVPQRAYGHELVDGKWIRADQSLTSATRGDGGLYCSLDDYRKWLAALAAHRLLEPEGRRLMFTPQFTTIRDAAGYGSGWFIDRYRDEDRVYHNGETRGFSHTAQTFPQRNAAIVLLLNSVAPQPMTQLGEKLADALLFDAASSR